MIFILQLIGLGFLFFLSDGALYAMGIPYTQSYGSALTKIHPAFYVIVTTSFMIFASRISVGTDKSQSKRLRLDKYYLAYSALVLVLVVYVLLSRGKYSQGELSFVIVTFLMPVFLYYNLNSMSQKKLKRICVLISVFFIVNSALAIVETMTDFRLFPFVAGETIKIYDQRPTAFLGHPLNNAALTGVYLVFLVFSSQMRRNWLRTTSILLHLIAMFAFGGRLAIVTFGIVIVLYLAGRLNRYVVTGRGLKDAMRTTTVGIGVIAFGAIVAGTSFAQPLIERFISDGGSATQRISAVKMIGDLSSSQFLVGTSSVHRALAQEIYDSQSGIEVCWLALALAYGVPVALFLAAAIGTWLWRCKAWKFRDDPAVAYSVLYFLIVISGSLSIGSKSLLISQVVALLMAISRRRYGERAQPEEDVATTHATGLSYAK